MVFTRRNASRTNTDILLNLQFVLGCSENTFLIHVNHLEKYRYYWKTLEKGRNYSNTLSELEQVTTLQRYR